MKRWSLVLFAGVSIAGCQTPNTPANSSVDSVGNSPSAAPTTRATTGPANTSANVAASPLSHRGVTDPVLARLKGNPITLSEIEQPLVETAGLNILLSYVQLQMAKQRAADAHVVVTPTDIKNEREQTIAKMFPDAEKAEYPTLYAQFLGQQHLSDAEFSLVMETNAYLRKIAEPLIAGKITEENLRQAFATQYGETVQVRHIECANLAEIAEAKRRLGTGEPFESVARSVSRNGRTAALGGELPPFSRQTANYPQAFKDAAFALKEGEVSDAVSAEGSYHLIKLEKRIPPKSVKFDDVKESLRQDLQEKVIQINIRTLRGQIAAEAIEALKIEDPVLKKQYDEKRTAANQQIQDRTEIRKQLDKERQDALDRAATQPTTHQ